MEYRKLLNYPKVGIGGIKIPLPQLAEDYSVPFHDSAVRPEIVYFCSNDILETKTINLIFIHFSSSKKVQFSHQLVTRVCQCDMPVD